jgi:hypothetical protein
LFNANITIEPTTRCGRRRSFPLQRNARDFPSVYGKLGLPG